jgi:biopolymer transport protein ExbB/TolQ
MRNQRARQPGNAYPTEGTGMETNTVVWIVVAVVAAVVVIAALAVLARRTSDTRKHIAAEHIREEVNEHTAKVDKRAALAEETAAKARAAEAEAEAKAAEAARLKGQASSHHEAVAASREDIEERRRHADHLDPKTSAGDDQAKDATHRAESGSEPAAEHYERR